MVFILQWIDGFAGRPWLVTLQVTTSQHGAVALLAAHHEGGNVAAVFGWVLSGHNVVADLWPHSQKS